MSRLLASVLALLLATTPAFILYENWYFYPHLEQLLLVLAGWCLLRSEGRGNAWMGFAFGSLAGLVLLRSLFHPLYLLIAIASAIALSLPGERIRE
jgi:hypothetical protein